MFSRDNSAYKSRLANPSGALLALCTSCNYVLQVIMRVHVVTIFSNEVLGTCTLIVTLYSLWEFACPLLQRESISPWQHLKKVALIRGCTAWCPDVLIRGRVPDLED